MKKTEVR